MGIVEMKAEDFLLSIDLLPLRLRSLAATELPVGAAAVADAASALEGRAATLGHVAYILAEHDWDLAIVGGFLLEARRRCRWVEVERLLTAHLELASLATVYLDGATGADHDQHELFWIEEENRLVTA